MLVMFTDWISTYSWGQKYVYPCINTPYKMMKRMKCNVLSGTDIATVLKHELLNGMDFLK